MQTRAYEFDLWPDALINNTRGRMNIKSWLENCKFGCASSVIPIINFEMLNKSQKANCWHTSVNFRTCCIRDKQQLRLFEIQNYIFSICHRIMNVIRYISSYIQTQSGLPSNAWIVSFEFNFVLYIILYYVDAITIRIFYFVVCNIYVHLCNLIICYVGIPNYN